MPVFPIVRRAFCVQSWLRFAVIIPRRTLQFIVIRINRDCRPFACRTFVIDARQATARRERRITDRSHAVPNHHARQTTAIIERIPTDRSHAVRNFHARQATAIRERLITDRRHAVRNFHARQAIAKRERPITDRSHSF